MSLRDIPGMKENELRKLSTCVVCKRKLGATGPLGIFHKVVIERFMIDHVAISRQTGLAMMLGGNGMLAHVMGPNEDLAKQMRPPITLMVCDECAFSDNALHKLFVLTETEDTNDDGTRGTDPGDQGSDSSP